MAVETTAAEAWITARLLANPTIAAGVTGIYSETVTQGTPPYIILTQYEPRDVTDGFGHRIDIQVVYVVRVVGQTLTYTSIEAIAAAIDTALNLQSGAANGHVIESCTREAAYSLVEGEGYTQYRHLGGRYRLWVQ